MVLLVLVLICLFSSFHIVNPGQRGVSVVLGKVDPTPRPEGIVFKKPFIENIINVTVKNISQADVTSCFSKDLQQVEIQYNVIYRTPVDKVVALYQEYSGNPWDTLVQPRMKEGLKQIAARYRAEELVQGREVLRKESLAHLRNAVGGLVSIEDLNIVDIGLSSELEKAIELKVVVEQQALAKKFELDKAIKDAEIQVTKAKGEAESARVIGEALAKNPVVVQLEIVKKWNGVAPQTVVTSEGGASVLLPTNRTGPAAK
jgi:regulator of protease activity HflC (stomatin/prohibitin superfamily)